MSKLNSSRCLVIPNSFFLYTYFLLVLNIHARVYTWPIMIYRSEYHRPWSTHIMFSSFFPHILFLTHTYISLPIWSGISFYYVSHFHPSQRQVHDSKLQIKMTVDRKKKTPHTPHTGDICTHIHTKYTEINEKTLSFANMFWHKYNLRRNKSRLHTHVSRKHMKFYTGYSTG